VEKIIKVKIEVEFMDRKIRLYYFYEEILIVLLKSKNRGHEVLIIRSHCF